MPIFISISFKLMMLELKEFKRICVGKGCFATQSRVNDFHTNPCMSKDFHPRKLILAYLTHGKIMNLGSLWSVIIENYTGLECKSFSFEKKRMEFSSV